MLRTPSWLPILLFLTMSLVGMAFIWMTYIETVEPLEQEPRAHALKKRSLLKVNEARWSDKWYRDVDIDDEKDEKKFHLITNIVLVHHGVNMLYDNKRLPTEEEFKKRQQEMEKTLQANLNHQIIAAVHVVYQDPDVETWLRMLCLNNSSKLILHKTKRNPTVGFNLKYIQKYLMTRYVILAHMDNALGEGWDDIDLTKFQTDRMMYALTRHLPSDKNCSTARSAFCNPGWNYVGSHDAFVFYMAKPFSREMLKGLDIAPNSDGMENVMIWYFKEKAGFKTLNPCKRVKIYHYHCVPVRDNLALKKRHNKNGKNGFAPYTDKLF